MGSKKASSNVIKHSVPFERACQAFFDPLAQVQDASTAAEQREAVVGLTNDATTLYVVHTWRDEATIRIISAREATATERRMYEDYA